MPLLNNRAATVRAAAVLVLGGLGLSACATREYVDEQIAGVNSRIDAVDARAQDAARRADAANQAAQAAGTEARSANQRIDQMEGRINALEQAPVRRPRG